MEEDDDANGLKARRMASVSYRVISVSLGGLNPASPSFSAGPGRAEMPPDFRNGTRTSWPGAARCWTNVFPTA